MWGGSSTDASYQNNFNVGFSTTKSDVLVHLAQWQYWWWFWFAFLWCFYYLVILRTVKHRALKMKPKIVTSYRPRSKWGDFLACIVPSIWCVNILTNSNLIMRLIEWQNESSLFTIRIRGRQWYWIYKFELKNFTDIISAPKNVGSNKWLVSTFGDLQVAEDYLHTLQLRAQSKWVKEYWGTSIAKDLKQSKHHVVSSIEQLRMNVDSSFRSSSFINDTKAIVANSNLNYSINDSKFLPTSDYEFLLNSNFFSREYKKIVRSKRLISIFNSMDDFSVNQTFVKKLQKFDFYDFLRFYNHNVISNYTSPDVLENTTLAKRSLGLHVPFRLIKNRTDIVNPSYTNNSNYVEDDLFSSRFGTGDSNIQSKPMSNAKYFAFKQQRSKKKKIAPIQKTFKTLDSDEKIDVRFSGHQVLSKNKTIETNNYEPAVQYKLFNKSKVRSEKIPVTLARRLLRTKRVLVVPAHVNVTAITNSYDVVHSWFIPGLGLKLDCVPGRSTHHTFFVDNVGFYYGQCAEICGRYHHHMPIRLCALPFEHFLVWWQSFGVSKLLFTSSEKKFNKTYSFRKYVW
jgi:heme/copper-type cytochrome/quinol oxidase subunit 2